MDKAPEELSGTIAIQHPNCGCYFEFKAYNQEENVNYFQCVRCGLALRVQAFNPEMISAEPEPVSETSTEQVTIEEQAPENNIEEPATQHAKVTKKRKDTAPDHIK